MDDKEKIKERKKVVSQPATVQKKSELKVLSESLFPKDMHGLLGSAIRNAASDMMYDIITNGAAIIADSIAGMLDPNGRYRDRKSRTITGRRDYTKSYRGGSTRDRDRSDENIRYARQRSIFDYSEIIFKNRGDAESVLFAMDDIIDQFGVVSVGDLYDISEVSTENHMVNKYGWSDIRDAKVIRVRKGYVIDLPKPMLLDID